MGLYWSEASSRRRTPRQLTNHRHLKCVTTLREIKIIFQPIYQELPIFRRAGSSKRKGGEEGRKKKRRRREREAREETTHTHMSCSHTFSHLILSYVLLSHPTCGIATPISKYNLSSALRGLCARKGGPSLPRSLSPTPPPSISPPLSLSSPLFLSLSPSVAIFSVYLFPPFLLSVFPSSVLPCLPALFPV